MPNQKSGKGKKSKRTNSSGDEQENGAHAAGAAGGAAAAAAASAAATAPRDHRSSGEWTNARRRVFGWEFRRGAVFLALACNATLHK